MKDKIYYLGILVSISILLLFIFIATGCAQKEHLAQKEQGYTKFVHDKKTGTYPHRYSSVNDMMSHEFKEKK